MSRFLFRGVNSKLFEATNGKLVPKDAGKPFQCDIYFGGDHYFSDGSVCGESERNSVVLHQRNSEAHKTSGVSTTPFFEKAKAYATHQGQSGYVFKIDTELLQLYGVKTHIVTDHASKPTKPDDQEVILVGKDFGVLPDEIIVEIIKVT